MKNLLLTFLLFIGISALVEAQSAFSLYPVPASATGAVQEGDVPVDAHITNLTNSTLNIKWVRRVIEITPGCETAVCDPNVCWARFVDSLDFGMDPNTSGAMLVHYYNNGAPCAGIVHVKLTNMGNPSDTLVGVYLFNQSSSVKDLPAANVKLYPNPVTDFFSLENGENVAAIRVFALDGRIMTRFDARSSNNVYSLQNLPVGNYVISLEDKNGDTFQAMELHKL